MLVVAVVVNRTMLKDDLQLSLAFSSGKVKRTGAVEPRRKVVG
jgi:hypothetical protein